MVGPMLLLISHRSAKVLGLLCLLALLIAFVPFLSTSSPLPCLHSFLPPSTLLTTRHIFLLANFIVLAILISSRSPKPSKCFPPSATFIAQPDFKPLSSKSTLSSHPANDLHSERRRPLAPPPCQRPFVIVPGSPHLRVPDHSHLHVTQNLPLATAKRLAHMQQPKQAFVTSAATTGAPFLRSMSDRGVPAIATTDLRKTLRKVETMNTASVVFRPLDGDPSMDVMDTLLVTNSCLSPDDFHKKCEDFIAKFHLDMKNNV